MRTALIIILHGELNVKSDGFAENTANVIRKGRQQRGPNSIAVSSIESLDEKSCLMSRAVYTFSLHADGKKKRALPIGQSDYSPIKAYIRGEEKNLAHECVNTGWKKDKPRQDQCLPSRCLFLLLFASNRVIYTRFRDLLTLALASSLKLLTCLYILAFQNIPGGENSIGIYMHLANTDVFWSHSCIWRAADARAYISRAGKRRTRVFPASAPEGEIDRGRGRVLTGNLKYSWLAGGEHARKQRTNARAWV